MPFIESVPSTEYMIAVNSAPFSLSEPNDNPRPIAGPRKNLSARLLSIGTGGRSTKTHSPSRWLSSERSAFPLSLRQVEDLLSERGIDVCHETVRYWWNRFGPLFAVEIRKRRVHYHSYSNWRWHLDEMFVRINGETHYLWRAVDHEGEVLEVFATKRRDRRAAIKFLKRTMKRYGRPQSLLARRPTNVVLVAMANKTARVVWAMLSRGEAFRAEARSAA